VELEFLHDSLQSICAFLYDLNTIAKQKEEEQQLVGLDPSSFIRISFSVPFYDAKAIQENRKARK